MHKLRGEKILSVIIVEIKPVICTNKHISELANIIPCGKLGKIDQNIFEGCESD